jgi:hypothetical protein
VSGKKLLRATASCSRKGVVAILERLPRARAVAHGSHISLEVCRKRFGWYLNDHHGDGRVALHCKSSADVKQMLRREALDLVHVPNYLGRHGWVGLWLDLPEVDWSLIEIALREAYRLTASKQLASALDGPADP